MFETKSREETELPLHWVSFVPTLSQWRSVDRLRDIETVEIRNLLWHFNHAVFEERAQQICPTKRHLMFSCIKSNGLEICGHGTGNHCSISEAGSNGQRRCQICTACI